MLRLSHGWSQDILAWKAGGLNKSYISAIERGKREPTEAVMHQFATAFGVSVDTLMAGATAEINALLRIDQVRSDLSRIVDLLAPADRDALLEYARALLGRQPSERLKAALLDQADIHGAIIQALEKQGVPVIDLLLAGLADSDPIRRTCAAHNLSMLKDTRAVELLIDTLQHDPADNVRINAALALGELGDERALPALEWEAEHDTGYASGHWPTVKANAAEAIERIKARSVLMNDAAENSSLESKL